MGNARTVKMVKSDLRTRKRASRIHAHQTRSYSAMDSAKLAVNTQDHRRTIPVDPINVIATAV